MNSKPPPPPPPAAMSKPPPPPPPHAGSPSTRPPAPGVGGPVATSAPVGSIRPPPPVSVAVQAPALPAMWQSRLRVSVKASARDATLLVVRPLPEGQRPPPGTHEAILTLVEGDGGPPNGSAVGESP